MISMARSGERKFWTPVAMMRRASMSSPESISSRIASRGECGAQEVHVADAGDLGRVLEGQEQPGGGAGFGGALEQVDAVEGDGAGGGVALAAGEDVGQGA